MQIRAISRCVLAMVIGMNASLQAAEPARSKLADKPAVVGQLEKQGLEIVGEFDAPGGLRGFAAVTGQQPIAVYVTPDGKHAVVGTLIDADGKNASAPALQRMVVEPMSKRIWTQLEKSSWVADGQANATRVVYAFMDPNCPYCHRFWEAARRWVQSGKVQLRHILVGVIREDSANKAAAILSADSPSKAFALHEQRNAEGGIQGLAVIPPDARARLEANEQLMTELGVQGTPGVLFLDEDGMLQTVSGMPAPEDMKTVLGPL
jgi:thiol:disulfide interchange protein DsbG